ncbi:MAG: hypothetical protein ACLP9L_25645, partial [Thermoguttaceae bacterium]
ITQSVQSELREPGQSAMSMTVADDAIIEAENQVNFNWARTLPSHHAATHTMYALALIAYAISWLLR